MKQVKVIKKYKATEGAQFSQIEAQIYGKCLDTIAEKKNGTLKKEDVVEAGKDLDSPLHDYFEWDNSVAGEKFRLEQARHLISHINVVIKYDHTQKEQRAFFSVQSTPKEDLKNVKYVRIERVMAEPELRIQVINNALKEVEFWSERYQEYTEFNLIFKAIKKVKKKVKIKKKK